MGKDSGEGEGLSVVLVDGASKGAIVPARSRDRLLPVPRDSVTLAGIREAARRVRNEQDSRNIAAIAEATIGRDRRRSGSVLPNVESHIEPEGC
jgi:hypothetical protein